MSKSRLIPRIAGEMYDAETMQIRHNPANDDEQIQLRRIRAEGGGTNGWLVVFIDLTTKDTAYFLFNRGELLKASELYRGE